MGGLAVAAALVVVMLSVGGGYLAKRIPFAKELEWSAGIEAALDDAETDRETDQYLQALAERLMVAAPMPEGMQVRVHYAPEDIVNAYATLGGNIVIYQGLLDHVPSENALAMVLAHEIAHVRERHPIEAIGRTAAVSLFMALLSASGNTGVDLLSRAGMLTMLKFNRSQEARADAIALEMVAGLYGHVADSDAFFRDLEAGQGKVGRWVPEFLQTHPLHEGRVEALHALAEQRGWSFAGDVQALPWPERGPR